MKRKRKTNAKSVRFKEPERKKTKLINVVEEDVLFMKKMIREKEKTG